MDTSGELELIKKMVHSVLVSSPERMTLQKLSRDYKEMVGSEVPHRQYGHRDVETFLRSMPDVIKVIGSGPMAIVQPLSTAKSAHIQKFVNNQKKISKKSRIPAAQKPSNLVFINERKALSGQVYNPVNNFQPQMLPNSQQARVNTAQTKHPINPIYSAQMRKMFDMHKYLYKNRNQNQVQRPHPRCNSTDNAPSGQPKKKEKNVSVAKQMPIEPYRSDDREVLPNFDQLKVDVSFGDDCNESDAFPEYAVNQRVLSFDYPRDAVRSDYKLPRRGLEKTLKVDERYFLQLVEVTNPHSFHFWIYDDYDLYDNFSHNMQEAYKNLDSTTFTMPQCLLTPGHLCVVCPINSSEWERAKVVSHRKNNLRKTIKVELIDTGVIDTVYTKDVKFLMKEFAKLPPQGMQGRLAYVAPMSSRNWSSKAVNAFKNQVNNRRLFGKVEAIKHNIAHMVLVGTDNVNFNRSLIDSGLVRRWL
ncbi:tudor domain-containing protein 5-like [Drosophila miranda]|uniref:tudor domain-containing protein 5-like n=1 Tax=Drosophila miranda TaxID=7229 RepID=UPI0007E7FD49|nr:tudor domain-containing protein 5-like [Drosophila miranda]XP_033245323.1 tudor domain-containing protein 5-like [Drosophila miranda]